MGIKQLIRNPYFWAITLRLGLMILMPRSLQGDAADYEIMATNMAEGRGLSRCYTEPFSPSAQRPPLYPLILALVYMMGFGHDLGRILLNLGLDLVSMRLVRTWGEDMGYKWAKHAPWVIALCPLLITFGMYPTTENLSITLFFAAVVLSFRKMYVPAGIVWGLLALSRSYYLLFPFFMWVFRPSKEWSRKKLAVMAAFSMLAPAAWMARNYDAFGKFVFSQSGMVGWQSYQGFCFPGFDWWNMDHSARLRSVPVMAKLMSSHCTQEAEVYSMDSEARELVSQCILDRPLEAARNLLIKEINLFTNWGLIMPYNRVPFVLVHLINAALFFYWWCVISVLWRKRRLSSSVSEGLRFSVLNIAYVVAVTLPFALDARYLLAPFLILMIVIFEIVKTPKKLIDAGLGKKV